MFIFNRLLGTWVFLDKEDGAGGGSDADVKVDADATTGDDTKVDADAGADKTTITDDDGDDGASLVDGLIGDTPDDARKVEIQADWPEDWRVKAVDGVADHLKLDDEAKDKLAKRMQRFSDPSKMLQSLLSIEQKMSSGEYKKVVDENSSEEELKADREERGVPETWEDYEVPDDLEIAEFNGSDDPLLSSFLQDMHDGGAGNAEVQNVLRSYDKLLGQVQEQQVENDKSYLMENEDALRTSWGEEYRPRVNVLRRALEDTDGPIPQEVKQAILSARDNEQRRVINNHKVTAWLTDLALQHYGDGALISTGQAEAMQSREDEIVRIMNSDIDKYYSEGLDKEYAKILEQKEKRGLL